MTVIGIAVDVDASVVVVIAEGIAVFVQPVEGFLFPGFRILGVVGIRDMLDEMHVVLAETAHHRFIEH